MNPSKAELSLSPSRFDVGAAMFRAVARQRIPAGKTKEETRLMYFTITQHDRAILTHAEMLFCKAASTMHPSVWNDRVCKSGEEAAAMLEAAANGAA